MNFFPNTRLDACSAGLASMVAGPDGAYTRYADDLTFSFAREEPGTVRNLTRGASAIVRDGGYVLHRKKKTYILRAHQRQTLAGLVVNVTFNLPQSTRRWLWAAEHRSRQGRHTRFRMRNWPDGGVF
jgi:RNA-directed DNA polymerase